MKYAKIDNRYMRFGDLWMRGCRFLCSGSFAASRTLQYHKVYPSTDGKGHGENRKIDSPLSVIGPLVVVVLSTTTTTIC